MLPSAQRQCLIKDVLALSARELARLVSSREAREDFIGWWLSRHQLAMDHAVVAEELRRLLNGSASLLMFVSVLHGSV